MSSKQTVESQRLSGKDIHHDGVGEPPARPSSNQQGGLCFVLCCSEENVKNSRSGEAQGLKPEG